MGLLFKKVDVKEGKKKERLEEMSAFMACHGAPQALSDSEVFLMLILNWDCTQQQNAALELLSIIVD